MDIGVVYRKKEAPPLSILFSLLAPISFFVFNSSHDGDDDGSLRCRSLVSLKMRVSTVH